LKFSRLSFCGLVLFVVGWVFLFQPLFQSPIILLRGFAFPCLIVSVLMLISCIDSPLVFRFIFGVSIVGITACLVCLFLPTQRTYSIHLLAVSALTLGISTPFRRITTALGAILSATGLVFLLPLPLLIYQSEPLARSNQLRPFALPLILTGFFLFSLSSSRKILVERLALGGIASGLIFLCQPFWEGFYQAGFQILLSGLVGFITISHR
jgi:hypothetical protein